VSAAMSESNQKRQAICPSYAGFIIAANASDSMV
jgi:hypothetical protein